jgi:uncharacterized membrane protein
MNGKGLAVILILMFGLAVGVGMVAGKLTARMHNDPAKKVRQGTLAEELQLTPEQNEQMRKIWQDVREKSEQWIKDAKMIQVHEDKELVDRILKTDEQRKEFQDLRNESAVKLNRLEVERKAAFDKAVEQTMPILNAEQRKMYGQIISEHTGVIPDTSIGNPGR